MYRAHGCQLRLSEPGGGRLAADPASSRAAPQIGAHVDPDYARGVVLVALAGVFWSIGGLLIRLIEAASAWQIVLFRALALALTLTLIIALRHRGRLIARLSRRRLERRRRRRPLSGGFIGFVLALHHTTVANATFMLGASPFFGALLGRLVLGETLRRATALAMAAALAGVLVMVGGGLVVGTIRGNLLALGASLSFAIFSVLLRRGREHDMLPCVAIAGAALGADRAAGRARGRAFARQRPAARARATSRSAPSWARCRSAAGSPCSRSAPATSRSRSSRCCR